MSQERLRRFAARVALVVAIAALTFLGAEIGTLVEEAQEDGVAVVLVGPPALYRAGMTASEAAVDPVQSAWSGGDHGERLVEYERKLRALESIASETGAQFVDMQSALARYGGDSVPLFIDKIHLSIAGNRFVAQELLPAVQDLADCLEPQPQSQLHGARRTGQRHRLPEVR